MSYGQNLALITGNVGSAPELHEFTSGKKVAEFSVATGKEPTMWHRVKVWNRTAEIAMQYLQKGDMVQIEGRIEYREVEKDGKKIRYTDIIGHRMNLLGRRQAQDTSGGQTSQRPQEQRQAPPAQSNQSGGNQPEDDLPF